MTTSTARRQQHQDGWHNALSFARRKGMQGFDYNEIASATERFLMDCFRVELGQAKAMGRYAAQLIDDELRECYLDASASTYDNVVIFNPFTGKRNTVAMTDVNEALRLLARKRGGNRN